MRTILLALLVLAAPLAAQEDVPIEYRVKAAYLYNFVKFVEWPAPADTGPLTICVAGRNPFGTVLEDFVRGETVNGRPLRSRVVLDGQEPCHVLFVPRGAPAAAYLSGVRTSPTLTVGEQPDFASLGGIVTFYPDGPTVRFSINPSAAERVRLRISSRLLQLARIVDGTGDTR